MKLFNTRLFSGSCLLFLTCFGMVWIYRVQEPKKSERLPRCFPTGEMFPYKDGKGNIRYDSVYHCIADFRLWDQNGQVFTNQMLKNKVYVANFFFITCPSICPRMTQQMRQVQHAFLKEEKVHFLSHTVDPEHDSVTVLKEYEQRNGLNGHTWHLLTGRRDQLYDLSKRSYYLGVANDSPDNFEHSEQFVLVDHHRVIRGYYSGIDPLEVDRLKSDIQILLRELKRDLANKN